MGEKGDFKFDRLGFRWGDESQVPVSSWGKESRSSTACISWQSLYMDIIIGFAAIGWNWGYWVNDSSPANSSSSVREAPSSCQLLLEECRNKPVLWVPKPKERQVLSLQPGRGCQGEIPLLGCIRWLILDSKENPATQAFLVKESSFGLRLRPTQPCQPRRATLALVLAL